jgi:hypothetical protein
VCRLFSLSGLFDFLLAGIYLGEKSKSGLFTACTSGLVGGMRRMLEKECDMARFRDGGRSSKLLDAAK